MRCPQMQSKVHSIKVTIQQQSLVCIERKTLKQVSHRRLLLWTKLIRIHQFIGNTSRYYIISFCSQGWSNCFEERKESVWHKYYLFRKESEWEEAAYTTIFGIGTWRLAEIYCSTLGNCFSAWAMTLRYNLALCSFLLTLIKLFIANIYITITHNNTLRSTSCTKMYYDAQSNYWSPTTSTPPFPLATTLENVLSTPACSTKNCSS